MIDEPIPTAADLLSRDYLALSPSLPLAQAVERLDKDHCHTAFVLDEHDQLLGVLTAKDCLRALGARAYDEAGADTVEAVMHTDAPRVGPDADLFAVAQTFESTPAAMLPVIQDNRLLGGVSQLRTLRALLAVLRYRAELEAGGEQVRHDLEDRPTSIERMQKVFADWTPEQIASMLGRSRRDR